MTTVLATSTSFAHQNDDTSELAAYWEQFKDLYQNPNNQQIDFIDSPQYEEGELESEWLQATGLGSLATPFEEGREVSEVELDKALAPLAREQAAAVRRRVRLLNRTIRKQKVARRSRKPDIRDVFRDLENSSGSEARSRSATPDSLDSIHSGGSSSPPVEWADGNSSNNYVSNCAVDTVCPPTRTSLSRTPSAPSRCTYQRNVITRPPSNQSPPLQMHEIFKHSDLHWADIATNTEGIELLSYQRFGTIQGPRLCNKRAITSIHKDNTLFSQKHPILRAKSAAAHHAEHLSFEHKFQLEKREQTLSEKWPEKDAIIKIDDLPEAQLKKLIPLVWLDLATLFDNYNLPFQKRKPSKKKRKEESEVFGVPLITLVRKDLLLWGDDDESIREGVPRVLAALTQTVRKHSHAEGVLRIPGNKQKVEALCSLIESSFYTSRDFVEKAINTAACHDVAALLKKLLRDLPHPVLTNELLTLFYQTNALSGNAQGRALNLLVLLLPLEHRATLYELIQLMNELVQAKESNKMTNHNVAMIIAPTLFPPTYLIKPTDTLEAQVALAANSCRVTEALMNYHNKLWMVPPSLLRHASRRPRQNGHRF